MKCVMISAGGTGGHINPALSLADTLQKRYPDCKIIFVGSKDRLESTLIPQSGYPFIGLSIANTHGNVFHKMHYGISLLGAYLTSKKLIRQYTPDVVIGFGNYISVPLLLAAHRKKIPTMISEQNSFAGKANVFLGKYVTAVELAYESSLKDFDEKKCRILGNPVSTEASLTKEDPELLKRYGLTLTKPFVAIMMGSLGSSSVSEVVDEAIALFGDDYEVLISHGQNNEYTFRNKRDNVFIADYVDGKKVLKSAALAVCRAGATTLCELTSIGTPSILIPSPYVPHNHQYQNALVLQEKGAAMIIEEKDLTAKVLRDTIQSFMENKNSRETMRESALRLAKNDCADKMVDWLQELTR